MVEIRELVIQARLQESTEVGRDHPAPEKKKNEYDDGDNNPSPLDAEVIQKIVERCLYEVQTWWRDKNLR
jgi:hypothetical protein